MIVKLLPHQKIFLNSKTKFVWLKAGLGAGKTFALSQYIIQRLLTNPETMGLITANSYKQLDQSVLRELFNQLRALNLGYNFNSQSRLLTLKMNGAQLLAISTESYEQLRGIELGWIAMDEAAYSPEDAYDVIIGRLRCKKSKALELRMTSTPNGFNYIYNRFADGGYISSTETPIFRRDDYHELISGSAFNNPYLPADYIPSLRSKYTALQFLQEIEGEFINSQQGKVYHAFNRTKHLKVSPVYAPDAPLVAGCDFNVNPLTAVVGYSLNNRHLHITNELWLENSNTFELADKLKEFRHIEYVAPDATGSARKSSSGKTDHVILKEAGFELKVSKINPTRKDRMNNVNRFLEQGWLTIDPSCTRVIADLEKHVYDETDETLGHISDALGYLVWRISPLRSTPQPSRIIA